MKFLFPALLCALAVGAAPRLHAQASDLATFEQVVGDYNLVAFGNSDLSFTSQDVEGPIAIGGNLTLGGDPVVTLQQFDASTNPTLYVQGTFAIANNQTVQLDNGYAALPGNAGTGTYPYQGNANRYQPAGTSGWLQVNSSVAHSNTDPRTNPIGVWGTTSLSSAQTQLTTVSQDLNGVAANGSIGVTGQTLTFTGAASGISVFDLNAANLTQSGGSAFYNGTRFTSLAINIPTNGLYVVNVTNAASDANPIFGPDVNFNLSTSQASQLLWNIVGSGSVTLGNNGQFYGSVLAPQFALSNGTNDPLTGQIVAGSIDYQNAELHFAGLAPIPEPPASALAMAFGVLAVCAGRVLGRRASGQAAGVGAPS